MKDNTLIENHHETSFQNFTNNSEELIRSQVYPSDNLSYRLNNDEALKTINIEMNQFLARKYLNNLYEKILDQFENLSPYIDINNKVHNEPQNDEHFEKIKTISERMQKGIEQLEDKLKKFYENDNIQNRFERQIKIEKANLIEDYNTPEFIEEKEKENENCLEQRSFIQEYEQNSLSTLNEKGVDYFTIGAHSNSHQENNGIKNLMQDINKNSADLNLISEKMNKLINKQDPRLFSIDTNNNENLDQFFIEKDTRQEVKTSSTKFNDNDKDNKISKSLLIENFSLKEKLKKLKIKIMQKESVIKEQAKQIKSEENSKRVFIDKYKKWKEKFRQLETNNKFKLEKSTIMASTNNEESIKQKNFDLFNSIENPNVYKINEDKNRNKINLQIIKDKNEEINFELIPNTINIYKGAFNLTNRNSSQFTLTSFEGKSDTYSNSNQNKNSTSIDNSLNESQKIFQKISSKLSRFCNAPDLSKVKTHSKSPNSEKCHHGKKNDSKSNLIKPSEFYQKISDSYYQIDTSLNLKGLSLNNNHNQNILDQQDLIRKYEENDRNITNDSIYKNENHKKKSIKKNENQASERKSYKHLTRKLRTLFNK